MKLALVTFTYPKSTIETIEKDVKYVHNNKDVNEVTDVVLVSLTLNIIHTFFCCFYC